MVVGCKLPLPSGARPLMGCSRTILMICCMREVAAPPSELQLGERSQVMSMPDQAAAQSVANQGSGGRTGKALSKMMLRRCLG
jgi:hypothetical protein